MTQEEYEEIQIRLQKGELAIESIGGFSKAPQAWIEEFQKLATKALFYEIENDLLPL